MNKSNSVKVDPCIILLDNGSLIAASTINLRKLAEKLSARSNRVIHPVSLLHSAKIHKSEMDGIPAEILEPFLLDMLNAGTSNFLILPLFFGQTAAVYEFIPQRLKEIRRQWPQIEVRIASCLVNLDDDSDHSMAEILSRVVKNKIITEELQRPAIAVVDHGTPRIAVNEVRNLVCRHLRNELRNEYGEVKAASMERRKGTEYDFNDPLLEDLLGSQGFDRDVVVALLFSSPGRHAGEGGDIAEICKQSELSHKGLRVFIADLPSTDKEFFELLTARLRQSLSESPVTD
jgi:sirohydrochlorin ferrochelatase